MKAEGFPRNRRKISSKSEHTGENLSISGSIGFLPNGEKFRPPTGDGVSFNGYRLLMRLLSNRSFRFLIGPCNHEGHRGRNPVQHAEPTMGVKARVHDNTVQPQSAIGFETMSELKSICWFVEVVHCPHFENTDEDPTNYAEFFPNKGRFCRLGGDAVFRSIVRRWTLGVQLRLSDGCPVITSFRKLGGSANILHTSLSRANLQESSRNLGVTWE